jgi:hypothetical protein
MEATTMNTQKTFNIPATYQGKQYNLTIIRRCLSDAIKAAQQILPNCIININQEGIKDYKEFNNNK